MKCTALLCGLLFLFSSSQGQIFTDGFESADGYAVGDYIGPGPNGAHWTTWFGNEGGIEDAQVTNAQAATGSNSIHLSSTGANGGPQDIILNYGQQYTSGVFSLEASFYVVAGANGHFNFQANPVLGEIWTLNCYMVDGNVIIDDEVSSYRAVGTYVDETWFTVRIESNLSLNIWKAFVDGNQVGQWINDKTNAVSYLNLYPMKGSDFYVDDIVFDHQPYTLENFNAAVAELDINGGLIAGLSPNPIVTVLNAGLTSINSFEVEINYNGNQYTEIITGQNIAPNSSMPVEFGSELPLVAGENLVTVSINNINGGSDDESSDDVLHQLIDPLIPAPGKVVVSEEATGTGCGWCPRGAVIMDLFEKLYEHLWIGIAVHNNDPMMVNEYDNGLSTLVTSRPDAFVDRGDYVDPTRMSLDFFTRIQVSPTALISSRSAWDPITRQLDVTVTAEFQTPANNQYKLACVLVEDSVTGGAPGYAQTNFFAGGGSGSMRGYENLPSLVPAAQMVYDRVARDIQPSFFGDTSSFPNQVNTGDEHSSTYSFSLPEWWDINNMYVIGLLIDPSGRIDNAGKISLLESTEDPTADIISPDRTAASIVVYPNPADDLIRIDMGLSEESNVSLSIIDISGKEIIQHSFGSIELSSSIQFNVADLQSGIYIVELTVDNHLTHSEKLIIK